MSDSSADIDRLIYAYDATGLVAVEGYLSQDLLNAVRKELDRLNWSPCDFPNTSRIDGLHHQGTFWRTMASELFENALIKRTLTYPHRLIESYALDRNAGGKLPLHGGSTERLSRHEIPEAEDIAAASFVRDGRIYSMRVKALVYLDSITTTDDGPLVYVEGSHKAHFPYFRTFGTNGVGADRPSELLRPVHVSAGTLIVLNEALVHGALLKQSSARRRVVVFTFAPSFVTNWLELRRGDTNIERQGYAVPDTEDTVAKP